MDRRERSDLLERLVALRRLYHLRSDWDSRPILTVAAAVGYGELLLRSTHSAKVAPPAA